MGWKAKAERIYETRVIDDALKRLSTTGREEIALSKSELRTLAIRTRQAIRNSPLKRERLERYKAHLSKSYRPELISQLALKLEEINNQIAYEEK
jgi:hypothetical protein